ncbi:DUF3999 family protein [Maribacter sp. ACAM166]|uniref:DUF3999 family protein n=1 Tax=Maribacter sp. ACAM166 TaxID=2508996 RepID=UPI0010FEBA6D|nr:DUF3999 family protein [Maribacter sp. ACAM166]TLP81624.1 DUF3999 family protein [Maribacter sp. ACAM166]
MNLNNSIYILVFVLTSSLSFGQMNTYSKKIELKRATSQWNKVVLPNEVFKYVKPDVTDVRIYGVTATDTIEAPYILNLSKTVDSNTSIPFELLNTVTNSQGYYYTYELPVKETINEIKLNFKNSNFNWLTTLEGSQDQQEWFTVLMDYRILSIVNDQTDYTFTNLKFPDANFKFYRLKISSAEEPILKSAHIFKQAKKAPEYRSYSVNSFETTQEKKNTIIDVNIKNRVPVSLLELTVDDKFDYYRPISIQYLVDSVKTDKGYYYNYRTLATRTLSSLESNSFQLPSTLAQKFRMIISNHDNQPLKISNVQPKGYLYSLTTRFIEPAAYFLVYGKPDANFPNYDIAKTPASLPDDITTLAFGKESDISKKEPETTNPLFENQWWLWAILGIIILFLGYFTIRMMQKKI